MSEPTDRLAELAGLCKHGVTVTINEHRDLYLSVEEYLRHSFGTEDEWELLPDAIRRRMVEKDSVVAVQAYPVSASGFILVFHHDLGEALTEAVKAVRGYLGAELYGAGPR